MLVADSLGAKRIPQRLVADAMGERAGESPPRGVLLLGDNFYDHGLSEPLLYIYNSTCTVKSGAGGRCGRTRWVSLCCCTRLG